MSENETEYTTYLSDEFNAHNHATIALAAHLGERGAEWGVTDRLICDCPNPYCEMRNPETFPVAVLMDAFAAYWEPESEAHLARDPRGFLAGRVGEAVVRFAKHFELPDVDETAPPHSILLQASGAWRARMAMPQDVPAVEDMEDLEFVEMRNREMVFDFAERMVRSSYGDLAMVAVRYAEMKHTYWGRESKNAAHHALTNWIPKWERAVQVSATFQSAVTITADAEWTAPRSKVFAGAVHHAVVAIMTHGIIDARFTRAMYEPFEPIIPFSLLTMKVLMEQRTGPDPVQLK